MMDAGTGFLSGQPHYTPHGVEGAVVDFVHGTATELPRFPIPLDDNLALESVPHQLHNDAT